MQTISGDLTLKGLPVRLPGMNALAAAGTLDLSGVTQADSAGLAYLLELQRRAQQQGHSLRFTQLPAQLLSLAQFFKLDAALSPS